MHIATLPAVDQPLNVLRGTGRRQIGHSALLARDLLRKLVDDREIVSRLAAREDPYVHVAQARPRIEPSHERSEQCEHGKKDCRLRGWRQRATMARQAEHALQTFGGNEAATSARLVGHSFFAGSCTNATASIGRSRLARTRY